MSKVFISFPMADKSYEELVSSRNSIIERLNKYFSNDVYYIDTIVKDFDMHEPLWYLGISIEALSDADIAVFAPGWEKARGCRIEHTCAVEYNIPILTL